jgi:hypothetical protein
MKSNMTDELQEPEPARKPIEESEPKAENPIIPVIEPNIISPTPKKSNKNLWIIAGVAIAVISICSVICIALVATGVGKILVEKAPVESVLDSFMKDMEAKDVKGAYALFSQRSQTQTPIADLEKMDQGNNYVLFEGYKSLSVQNINLTAAVNTNPKLPQGTVATVVGTISYDGGFTGQIKAVLEKVDSTWKIFNITVTVPPDKFHP